MSTIKQETIDNIEQSRIIMSSIVRYGNRSKISFTWHTNDYAFTVEAWATITLNKHNRLTTWDKLYDLLKPSDFIAYMESKATGESKQNEDQTKCKAVFKLVCDELAKRSDSCKRRSISSAQEKLKRSLTGSFYSSRMSTRKANNLEI